MDEDESDKLVELISYFKFYIKELDDDINILIKLLKKHYTDNNNYNSNN
jgi:hypothetical protein